MMGSRGTPEDDMVPPPKDKLDGRKFANDHCEGILYDWRNDGAPKLMNKTRSLWKSIYKGIKSANGVDMVALELNLDKFLMGREFDDCVRWWLLYHAIVEFQPDIPERNRKVVNREKEARNGHMSNGSSSPSFIPNGVLHSIVVNGDNSRQKNDTTKTSNNPSFVLTRVLLSARPHLSFESAKMGRPEWDHFPTPYHKDELNLKKAISLFEIKSPFHYAAEEGVEGILSLMIDYGETLFPNEENPKAKLVSKLKETYPTSNSALSLAVENKHLGIIIILLNYDTSIADKPDVAFNSSIAGGSVDVVNLILELRKDLLTTESLGTAVTYSKEDIMTRFMQISPKTFDASVAKKIIESDLWKMWQLQSVQDACKTLNEPGLLHHAVQHQRPRFVKYFLDQPRNSLATKVRVAELGDAIDRKETDKYPLWHNNFVVKPGGQTEKRGDSPSRNEIRSLLVTAIIRSQKMEKISEIFFESREKAKEVCFDLSHFDSKSYVLGEFVDSLVHYPDHAGHLSYETTLRYADFPPLDLDSDGLSAVNLQKDHTEVFDILTWLKRENEETTIMELNVPDRLHNPHNEVLIGEWVEKLEVEILNWRYLDLGISVLGENSKNRIKKIHLYSSGKRAAVDHWLSSDGVKSLTELEEVTIHIVEDLMSEDRAEKFLKYVQGECEKKLKPSQFYVALDGWNPKPVVPNMRSLDQVAKTAVPELFPFIKAYESLPRVAPVRPTKVAIIDNGVLNVSPVRPNEAPGARSLWSRIKEGRSFVGKDYKLSPWLFASDPHGTQMANLICAIDPHCELYVAKVAEGRFGIYSSRVTKAIEWAVHKEVDIISMSFAIQEPDPDLDQAIKFASSKGIVQLCSTHDEGSNIATAYPAACRETITIAACDEFGGLPHKTPPKDTEFEYQIHGTEISAGVVPFLKSVDKVTGSSVATAIAAGLSSLILSCHRFVNPDYQHTTTSKESIIKAVFKNMIIAEKNKKYILLRRFCGMNEVDGDLDVDGILRKVFKEDLKVVL